MPPVLPTQKPRELEQLEEEAEVEPTPMQTLQCLSINVEAQYQVTCRAWSSH
jgi:hypothetical protein